MHAGMFCRRPSPSMVVALIALFVALGGTGYAALKLPANSVGTKQLKKNAVTGAKVKDFSLFTNDFAPGQIPRGRKARPVQQEPPERHRNKKPQERPERPERPAAPSPSPTSTPTARSRTARTSR